MKQQKRKFRLIACGGLVAIVLLFSAFSAAQKKPPKPPPTPSYPAIAFSVSGPNRYDLLVMNDDGSNQQTIASEKWVNNLRPDWSPDAGRIAIETYNPAAPPCDLVIYNIGYDSINGQFKATLLGSVIVPGSILDIATDVCFNDWAKTQDKLLVHVLFSGAPTPSGLSI